MHGFTSSSSFKELKKSLNQFDLKDFGHNIDNEHFIFLSCLIEI